MAISAQEVNKLRQMTGAGMMDCKKALVEADGDFEKAIEFLGKKGKKYLHLEQIEKLQKGLSLLRHLKTDPKAFWLPLHAKLTL